MKKLKVKVFSIIFLLLSIFTLIIFVSFTARNYFEQKRAVSDILTKVSKYYENMDSMNGFNELVYPKNILIYDSSRVYFDFTIYTVIFDNYGKNINVLNNISDEVEKSKIEKISKEIIKYHENDFYVGNLYTDKYSYVFSPYNKLFIMDNSEINSSMISQLVANISLFIFCEFAIFLFTYLITKWIITPVNKSFEKQKVFVADASHELKTPLSVMIASADAYFNDKDDKWVKNMKNESERMIKLVTELLDLAKIEQEQDIVMDNNNLSDIVEGAILTFESLFYDNSIKLKYDITPNIMFSCNEDLIIDLMSILIDNAIKHCSKNGKVFVNLFRKNKQIILEVKNTGLPIKKEDEEKIFERFYKADASRNRNSNNYGLGLAIAKNIVEKHNGKISAHSDDGYTVFKVEWN